MDSVNLLGNHKNSSRLNDRVVYVTGGLERIGKAACDELSELGASVVGLDTNLPDTKGNEARRNSIFDMTDTKPLEDRLLTLEKTFGPAYG